jgi:RNAse (barnase) inhibitor barstar
MYPPARNFTSANFTVSGQAYGDGLYNVTHSPSGAVGSEPFYCFNTSNIAGGLWASAQYSGTTGEYIGNQPSFESAITYKGDWLKIKLPVSIQLTKYSIYQRISNPNRAPKDFKIYGSNDDGLWDILVTNTSTTYTTNVFNANVSTNNYYTYYLLVVNKLLGTTETVLNFDEWFIFGKEKIASFVIDPTYKYLAFTYQPDNVEIKTGVGGWRLVRFVPPTSSVWHPINDNLAGTETYGTANNYTNAWSIPFGTFDEFCFGTLNLQYWLYAKKNVVIGNYENVAKDIIKSSFSSIPYQAIWYSRTTVYEIDPMISIQNHPTQVVYGEGVGQYGAAGHLVSADGGMGVWVRNSANSQPSQTSYTVSVPTEGTECSALIIGNLNYNYIPSLQLFGTYNISVGSNSSITNSNNNAITYTSETSNLSISNSITGASITYTSNQPKVIIKYKLTKGTGSYNIKTPGILKYTTSTPSSTPSNTGTWTIEESANTTFKSDFLNRLTAPSPSTSITQVNGNNYTTDFLFDPDTKFTDKADWGRQYKYNLCLSVESTNTSDKQKYCVAFVFFNNKSGTPVFQHTIISSNRNADWTISDYTQPTTNKKYVKITVKTVNTINTLNIKI